MFDSFFERIKERGIVLNYMQVFQHDEILADYSRLDSKTRLNTWSLCKSIVSCGIGIAIDEGYLSLDEKLIDSFAEYQRDDLSPSLKNLTLRDMLTMTSGMEHAMFFGDDPLRYETQDWVSYFFAQNFPYPNGERFLYSNFNTYMAAVLAEKKTGRDFLDYMNEKFFAPLGIRSVDWTRCPKGHIHAANGLYVTIDEISSFGRMLLNHGMYNGKQIVPEDYLADAVRNHIQEGGGPEYGYQFWLNSKADAFYASGKFGQYCVVIPKKNAFITSMALDSQDYLDLIMSEIADQL